MAFVSMEQDAAAPAPSGSGGFVPLAPEEQPEEKPGLLERGKRAAKQIGSELAEGVRGLAQSYRTVRLINEMEGAKYGAGLAEQATPELRARMEARAAERAAGATGIAREIASSEAESTFKPRPVVQEISQAKTFGDAWRAFKSDPINAIAGITAQSAPAMVPALVVGMFNAPAGVAALGASSAASEFGSSLMDYMTEHGLDPKDSQALQDYFSDPVKLQDAMKYAATRAGIIGATDLTTAGLATKTLAPAGLKSRAAKQLVNIPTQMGLQAAGGGFGEVGAQLATKGEITDPGSVVANIVGEFGGAPAEALAFGREAKHVADAAGKKSKIDLTQLSSTTNEETGETTFHTPSGVNITKDQWDNAGRRVREAWLQPSEGGEGGAGTDLQQVRSDALQKWSTLLPSVPRGVHEELAKISPTQLGAEDQGKLQELRGRLQEKGQDFESAVRRVWGADLADASPGLRKALEGALAVSAVPPESASQRTAGLQDGRATEGAGGAAGVEELVAAPPPKSERVQELERLASEAETPEARQTLERQAASQAKKEETEFSKLAQADDLMRLAAKTKDEEIAADLRAQALKLRGVEEKAEAETPAKAGLRAREETVEHVEAKTIEEPTTAEVNKRAAVAAEEAKAEPVGPSRVVETKPEPEALTKTRSESPILKALQKFGGIKESEMSDMGIAKTTGKTRKEQFVTKGGTRVTREVALRDDFRVGKDSLFRKDGKLGIDNAAEWLQQHGYLADQADHERAREIIRKELAEPGSMKKIAVAEEDMIARAQQQREDEANAATIKEASDLGIETKGRPIADVERALVQALDNDWTKKTGQPLDTIEHASIARRASDINEQATHDAAVRHGDDEAGFIRAAQEIIDAHEKRSTTGERKNAEPAADQASRRAAAGEGKPQAAEAKPSGEAAVRGEQRLRVTERGVGAEAGRGPAGAGRNAPTGGVAPETEAFLKLPGAALHVAQTNLRARFKSPELTLTPADPGDRRALGRKQAIQNTLAEGIIRDLAKTVGLDVKVVWYDQSGGGPSVGGFSPDYARDTIFMNVRGKSPAVNSIGHEFLHWLKKNHREDFNYFAKSILPALRNLPEHRRTLNDLYEKYGAPALDVETAFEELLADVWGDVISDPKFYGELAKQNPDAFRSFAAKILEFFDRLLSTITSKDVRTQKFLTEMRAARKAVADTLSQMQQRGATERELTASVQRAQESLALNPEEFAKSIRDQMSAARETADALARQHKWKYEVGDLLHSKQTGKTVEIVERSFSGQGQKVGLAKRPTYAVRDSDGNTNLWVEQNISPENYTVIRRNAADMAAKRPVTAEDLEAAGADAKKMAEHKQAVDARIKDFLGEKAYTWMEQNGLLRPTWSWEDTSPLARDREVIGYTGVREDQARVVLYYDRVTDLNRVPELLMHEIGTHFGMRRMLGDEAFKNLLEQVRALKERKDAVFAEAWSRVKRDYVDEQGKPFFPEGSDAFIEEVAAAVVESQPQDGFVKRLISQVRAWVHQNISPKLAGKMDESLLKGLALAALRKTGRGELSTEAVPATPDQAATDVMMARPGRNPPPKGVATTHASVVEKTLDFLNRHFLDSFSQLKKRQLAGIKGQLTDQINAYAREQLMHGRATERLKDLNSDYLAPMIKIAGEAELTREDVSDGLYAIHAPEANAYIATINPSQPDGGSGLTNKAAAQILKSYTPDQRKALDKIDAIVQKMNGAKLDRMVSEGLITPQQRSDMQQRYKHWLSMKQLDDEENFGFSGGGGLSVKGKEFQARMGRFSEAEDPLSMTVRDAMYAVMRAEKNRVARTFHAFVRANPNPAAWEEVTQANYPTQRIIDAQTGQVRTVPDPLALWREPEYFGAKVNGEQKWIRVKDPLLAEQMKKLGDHGLDSDNELVHMVMKAVNGATRILSRFYTQFSPDFALVNPIRDLQHGVLIATSLDKAKGKEIALRMLKNLPAALRDAAVANFQEMQGKHPGGLYEQFRQDGGTTGGFGLDDAKTIQKEMERAMAALNGDVKAKALLGVQAMLKPIMALNDSFENMTRFATYKAALEAKMTREQAAVMAKNVTVNFNKRGQASPVLNALYAFFNASLQANAQVVRGVFRSRIVQVASLGLFAAGAYAALSDDEDERGIDESERVSEFVQDRNYVVPYGDKKAIKVPLAYGFNIPYATGRHFVRVMQQKESVSHMLGAILKLGFTTFLPTDSPVPTVAQPVADVVTGKDFAGRQIAKENPFDAVTPKSSQYKENANAAAVTFFKTLNAVTGGSEFTKGAIDVSPEKAAYLVKQYLGGLAVPLELGALPFAEKSTMADIPVARRFVAEAKEDIYVTKAAGIIREGEARRKEIEAGAESKPGEEEYVQTLRAYDSALRRLSAARNRMLKEDKKADVSEVDEQRNLLADQVLTARKGFQQREAR